MEVENKEGTESPLPNGSTHPPKRGRGRPRGSLNKKFTTEKAPTHNARPSKKVDFFSPDTVIKTKVKKRGRPKKIKMPGRPRKIPLTPEEESERLHRMSLQRKRRLSKPLGRPRIHPVAEGSKAKRGRGRPPGSPNKKFTDKDTKTDVKKRGRPKKIKLPGRPRKIPLTPEEESERLHRMSLQRKRRLGGAKEAGVEISVDAASGPPRKRGRPAGSVKKKRGRPADKLASVEIRLDVANCPPRKRGRPQCLVLMDKVEKIYNCKLCCERWEYKMLKKSY
uniref:Si:ch211-288g17.3 n=1 Tax=Cyprinus carpio carpio TaxID=630221 RepID=A0A9J8DC03_CYPCA